jgi:hypothetical protein
VRGPPWAGWKVSAWASRTLPGGFHSPASARGPTRELPCRVQPPTRAQDALKRERRLVATRAPVTSRPRGALSLSPAEASITRASDDTLGPRLYERGLVVKCGVGSGWLGSLGGVVVRSGAHLSIASSTGGPGDMGGRLRGRKSEEGRQAARRKAAPPGVGAKGWLRVSMCQIASVSFLAMSIWATLAPRCLPSRCLLRS